MGKQLSDEVVDKLKFAENLYHRLILIVGPEGKGRNVAMQEIAKRINTPLVNINLELSRRMLDLTERQRVLQVHAILDQIIDQRESDSILLDNIEILFDVALKQDPLRLLQGLSRNRIVVANWNGSISSDHLTYAEPHHPEYRRYPLGGFLVVSAEAGDWTG